MATPKDCVAVNGRKYFFWKNKNNEWVGSVKPQAIYSRTFLPKDTEVKQADDLATLVSILKTDAVPLKEANLDEETKAVFDAQKVVYEKEITDIGGVDIGSI